MRLINTETFELKVFSDDEVPPYAILSHTWGSDSGELTFSDVTHGIVDKPGIGSFKFKACCKQAKADKIDYAWIDTCCINKTDLVELGEAINSMFRWYSLATVCYAYLSDVPAGDDLSDLRSKFRTSRWFKRGWTLQELLAPKYLRFYSSDWCHIGDKGTKSSVIQNITRVPRRFLLGITELHSASVAQRMSWAAQRETKRAEDLAYCLLGIFGIAMPMIYGEGGEKAFFRLQEQIMKTTRDDSLLAWGLSNEPSMSHPPQSIDGDTFIHGDILAASPSDFANSWQITTREQATNPLHSLDIFGGSLRIFLHKIGPFGLLSCGPISDTQKVVAIPLAKINSTAANEYVRPQGSSSVLHPVPTSGVSPELIHIKKDGQKNVSTKNQHYLLYEEDLFAEIGLDIINVVPGACWDKKRALISQTSNDSVADQILIRVRQSKEQSLDFVIMIDFQGPDSRTELLCCVFTCDRDTALEEIASGFQRKTLEAFRQTNASNGPINLNIKLEYVERNITSITPEATNRLPGFTINATMALKKPELVLEPIRLLWEKKQNDVKMESWSEQIAEKFRLGFIESQKEKEKLASAERRREQSDTKTLRWKVSVYNEENSSMAIEEMAHFEKEYAKIRERHDRILEQVVLAQKHLKEFYGTKDCRHGWNLFHSAKVIGDISMMDLLFDEKTDIMAEDKQWLPWITASRNGDVDKIRLLLTTDRPGLDHEDGIFGRTPLSWAIRNGHRDVVELLLETMKEDIRLEDHHGRRWALDRGHHDIMRLLRHHENIYHSMPTFGSFFGFYRCENLSHSVALSPDLKLVTTGSSHGIIKFWDSETGQCVHTLQAHDNPVRPMAFSHDSKLLASGSSDKTVRLWDSQTGKCIHTLQGHDSPVCSVAFSHDAKLVASGLGHGIIKLWDTKTGGSIRTIKSSNSSIPSVAFSHDSKIMASGSCDWAIKLWDIKTGDCMHTLQSLEKTHFVTFLNNSKILASTSLRDTVELWDSKTGGCIYTR